MAQALRTLRAFSNEAALLCAFSFLLLLATAISNFLRVDVDTGTAPFGDYMEQFALPAIPLGLTLALLALRSHAAATVVATLGSLFYLVWWVIL